MSTITVCTKHDTYNVQDVLDEHDLDFPFHFKEKGLDRQYRALDVHHVIYADAVCTPEVGIYEHSSKVIFPIKNLIIHLKTNTDRTFRFISEVGFWNEFYRIVEEAREYS